MYFRTIHRICLFCCMAALAILALTGGAAWACIGADGTIPPFGGSPPNGIMFDKIEKAWADAAAKGTVPPSPPISGTHKAVILLIENAAGGAAFAYPSAALWSQRLTDMAAYYTQVSNGLFTIAPAEESHGTANDGVIGPITVSGLSSSSDIQSGNSEAIAVQAIKAANAYINFAPFDTDSSGTIEPNELHILIYQAGDETSYYQSAVPRAWAHEMWRTPRLSGLTIGSDSDGKNIVGYCYCGSEFNGSQMAKMGPMTHELGHDIGLPDLYDADGSGSGGNWAGLGMFSLMASGSWGGSSGDLPVHVDGFLKSWLGWADVTTMTAPGNQTASLDAANGSNAVLRINVPGSQEFFIVENRQQTGYDAGLPGTQGGLAIFHCDGTILVDDNIRRTNAVNQSPTDFGIALEEADGMNHLLNNQNQGQDTDLFRSGNNATFNASSTPNSNLKSGTASNVALTGIGASGATMTFSVGTPVQISVSISPPSTDQTVAGPVSYTVTYTGAANITLSPADVTLVADGTATGTVFVTGSGNVTRTITISDITGDGRLTIRVAAGTADDGEGHLAPAINSVTGFWVGLSVPVAAWPVVPALLAAGWALLRRSARRQR
ncbi:MAG TPA: M6 family metalloprotease domain-containing protein [Candidatus Hydrogenedentes bacterium]|nr:M6 family metalloprotease domain-containing protein [Candidatus Hydrogenedentota bacterium]HRT21497.1 M6 family metalloprotease domain-containing protein [Candidatus Hydrogenedentota bacterium]HRT66201.1 M6 family metalloprotease domain-containing protein [Candidatus Hydrogenedentota bacterium]